MVSREPVSKLIRVNVLVLDASAQIRARLQALLAEAGDVEVLEASNAEAALSVLKTSHIDLVVLDVHLSTNGGLEVVRRIRQQAPRIVSIVLTNEASEHHRRECLSHGADFFFDKSRHFEHVVAIVEHVARRASQQLATRS
jgi:two-component system, NarL family, response regulator DevR